KRDDISDRVGELTMPALVVHGTEDLAIGIDVARALAATLPTADLVEVEGAGHAANLTHSEAVNPPLREFLERV
ncbi:MAG: hypothetical protein QOG62_1778, partial [Thermoleophilaceae bacterium]|nr:hypothetical protein [Thermoleophilaceae bacterium]